MTEKRRGRRPLFSVAVPFYNEQENLRTLYERLCRVVGGVGDCDFELLFVDDGSTDSSLEVVRALAAQDARVRYLSFSRNFGKDRKSVV